MGRLTGEQIEQFAKGGAGSFFKLTAGQSVKVRFLYNTLGDIEYYGVHEFSQNGNYATIDCAKAGNEQGICKWCEQGNRPVGRVIIPLYNMDSNEIQYWKRSVSWVKDTLVPLFEQIPNGMPISGQTFSLSRKGTTMQDTVYSPAPDLGAPNDGRRVETFGEIKDPFELKMIREADFEFDPNAQPQQANNQAQQFTSTRRTTDVF